MVSRLHSRLDRIEQQSAPMKAEQERLRAARRCRAQALEVLKDRIDHILSLSRYVHGELEYEDELIKDIVEINIMFQVSAKQRYGIDEANKFNATPDQLKAVHREAAARIDQRFYNYPKTIEEFDKTNAQWTRAREDMESGIDSAESEAAEYLRQFSKRYPRNKNTKRFYEIWE
jgi:prefoldin subunit 5